MNDRTVRAALERHWAASDASDFKVEHEIYRSTARMLYLIIRNRGIGSDPVALDSVDLLSHILRRRLDLASSALPTVARATGIGPVELT